MWACTHRTFWNPSLCTWSGTGHHACASIPFLPCVYLSVVQPSVRFVLLVPRLFWLFLNNQICAPTAHVRPQGTRQLQRCCLVPPRLLPGSKGGFPGHGEPRQHSPLEPLQGTVGPRAPAEGGQQQGASGLPPEGGQPPLPPASAMCMPQGPLWSHRDRASFCHRSAGRTPRDLQGHATGRGATAFLIPSSCFLKPFLRE